MSLYCLEFSLSLITVEKYLQNGPNPALLGLVKTMSLATTLRACSACRMPQNGRNFASSVAAHE